jgi:hypothetical protein
MARTVLNNPEKVFEIVVVKKEAWVPLMGS